MTSRADSHATRVIPILFIAEGAIERYEIEATEAQIAAGDHWDMARERAVADGYDPGVGILHDEQSMIDTLLPQPENGDELAFGLALGAMRRLGKDSITVTAHLDASRPETLQAFGQFQAVLFDAFRRGRLHERRAAADAQRDQREAPASRQPVPAADDLADPFASVPESDRDLLVQGLLKLRDVKNEAFEQGRQLIPSLRASDFGIEAINRMLEELQGAPVQELDRPRARG